jgi:hypothetical protein
MMRRHKILVAALWFLLASPIALAAQAEIPRQTERQAEPAAKKLGEEVFGKSTERDFEKYFEEEKKFYNEYSKVDRSYFSFFSAAEIKRPFNQLVDDAILSIRTSQTAKLFENAGNQQIVDTLSRQNQALAPPQRLKLELQENLIMPDKLEVSKADGSASGSVRMSTLKDYISDAIEKTRFPPYDPSQAGHLHIDPRKLKVPGPQTIPAQ